jgi:hypothetical protein
MAFWVAKNGGQWNGSPTANPATNVGGISLAPISGSTVFPTAQGTGDGHVLANFGASSFAFTPPSGFSGCAHGGGGFTTWDPSKLSGSATLSSGNLEASFPTVAGMAQTVDGYSTGQLYFELTISGQDVFSRSLGGGVAVQFVGAGGDQSFWFFNGQFATGNANGGAVLLGGTFNTFEATLGAFGNSLVSDIFTVNNGDVLQIAFIPETSPSTTTADMADWWFGATPGFVDLSVADNRRKFIDANGCPLFLGAHGELPLNNSPPMFLTAVPAPGSPASFAGNNGLGGAFTVSGESLVDSTSSPCCSITDTANFNVPLGADPQVRMSVSDDGGRTWNEVTKNRSLGKKGMYLQRLRWLKMGQFRQRIVKLEITDPVKRRFVGFYADITEGMG